MPERHITEILDHTPFKALSESELSTIHEHAGSCIECANAVAAAQLSSVLLRERISEAAESAANANPFFQTRVLAAWREQEGPASGWSFRRLWNATGAIVASMAATTAALAVLTFVVPQTTDTNNQQTAANLQAAAPVPYSAETVVLDQDQDDNQLTNDQVISAIYVDDDEGR